MNLITTDQIKTITVIQGNVDAKSLEPFISLAEDLHLRNLLGEGLYSDLKAAQESNTLSPMYETLYAFCIPVLSYYAFYEYLPFSLVKVTNKGVEKKTGSNGEAADIEELKFLRSTVLNYAKAYAKELSDWLNLNKDAFIPFNKCPDEPNFRAGQESVAGMFFRKQKGG